MLANRRPRLGRNDKSHPVGIRLGAAAGNDLDRLAVLQLRSQWHEMSIDLCGHAAISDGGMYRISEVDRGRALGQRHDVAGRRKHINLVGKQVYLDAFEKLFRTAGLLNLDKVGEPLPCPPLRCCARLVLRFVLPVCGNAGFGHPVHLHGANLHFERQSFGAEQGCMQRLITVDTRNGYVVFESTRHGLI